VLEYICDLLANFSKRKYAEVVWEQSDLDLVTEDVPFGSFQFTITEVESALLDLDDPNSVPPFVLNSCACAFDVPFSRIFNRSLTTSVISKNGRRNNVTYFWKNAVLSATRACKLPWMLFMKMQGHHNIYPLNQCNNNKCKRFSIIIFSVTYLHVCLTNLYSIQNENFIS
jgi:hypothetical protein